MEKIKEQYVSKLINYKLRNPTKKIIKIKSINQNNSSLMQEKIKKANY